MHDEVGALGLVINRPTTVPVKEIIEQVELKPKAEINNLLLEGGPVSRSFPTMIHTKDFASKETIEVSDQISVTMQHSSNSVFDALAAIAEGKGPEKFLFLLGYAGWSPGQLEKEIASNSWVHCPADPTILFDEPYESRLDRVASNIDLDFDRFSPQVGDA